MVDVALARGYAAAGEAAGDVAPPDGSGEPASRAVGGLPAPVALPGCIEDVPGLVGRVGGTDANPQVGIGEDPGEGIGHEHAEPRHTRAHCRPTQSAGPAPSVTDAEWPWPLPSSHSRWTEVPGLRAATIERKESADVTG